MKKYGGFIPGIRAGRPTAEYLDYVLTRHHAARARSTSASIALIPLIALVAGRTPTRTSRSAAPRILIMVGVGLETVKQIERQLQQRNYEGFLR